MVVINLSGNKKYVYVDRSSGQLRNTLSRARELCERWRSGVATPAPPAPPPDDEGGGRLARWFSMRRGSTHQYDMHSHEAEKLPKLPAVSIAKRFCQISLVLMQFIFSNMYCILKLTMLI